MYSCLRTDSSRDEGREVENRFITFCPTDGGACTHDLACHSRMTFDVIDGLWGEGGGGGGVHFSRVKTKNKMQVLAVLVFVRLSFIVFVLICFVFWGVRETAQ